VVNASIYAALRAGFPADLDAVAIETADGAGAPLHYTWRDLERGTAMIANVLASLHLAEGSRVAVQTDKSVEALMLYLAVQRAGCVYLPLNSAYQQGEIGYFLKDAEPVVVIAQPSSMPWLTPIAGNLGIRHVFGLDEEGRGTWADAAAKQPAAFTTVARKADDLAAILYTSGTTGRSKGAMLTQGNLASNGLALHRTWGFGPEDVLVHMLPLFHVHGLFVACHCVLLNGTAMRFHARFDPKKALADLAVSTVFMGVPTFYTRLLAEPGLDRAACARMRLFVSGSAPLLAETHVEFEARTGQRILERYGMTETGMLTSNPWVGERRAGSVGPPLPGVQVRVVDDDDKPCAAGEIGHVQVKGANVFPGYWRMPERNKEEFTADGWFRTGDVGSLSADGYLTIVGRSKDLIITGGYNVYPKEIELAIDELEGVKESAVVGVPHTDFGEAVTAIVVASGTGRPSEASIITALKAKLANFKVPKRVHFVDDLPRNAMGKVQKNVLRERFGKD
jgi:malonyl-CoA/methylmalonyl-CoA synthetase